MGSTASKSAEQRQKTNRDIPSRPVAVPAPSDPSPARTSYAHVEGSVSDMSYHLSRPPRLPLPIEEEIHTPGSPIVPPADSDAPVVDDDTLDGDGLTRKSSQLSSTTVDDDDADELQVDKTKATVPTLVEWMRGGHKVYVTGTIFQWNRKHRLHPV
jgi:hypothetical protein